MTIRTVTLITLAAAFAVSAAQAQMPTAAQMQDIEAARKAAEAMQKCMDEGKFTEAYLNELNQRSEEMQRKVDALCQKGNWKEATAVTRKFGEDMANDPRTKKMQECSDNAYTNLPAHLKQQQPAPASMESAVYKGENICAEMAKEDAESGTQ